MTTSRLLLAAAVGLVLGGPAARAEAPAAPAPTAPGAPTSSPAAAVAVEVEAKAAVTPPVAAPPAATPPPVAPPVATPPAEAVEPTTASAESPVAVVERFHEVLIGVMQEAKSLGIAGRYERLEPAVRNTFDLGVMLRIASGASWAKGDAAERTRATAAFEKLSIATYADRFNGFSGQSFETLGSKPGPQKTMLVETRINRPNDEPVAITYVLREGREGWRAIDVLLAGGVSELARYRSDYKKTLGERGLAGLAEEIDAKTKATLSAES